MVIVILENSPIVAERLVDLIADKNKDITFYQAFTYEKGITLLTQQQPAVVLLELNFAGNNILDLLILIKALNDKTIVFVLFSTKDKQKLAQCKTHGADYVLDKYNEFEKIPEIISGIVNSKDDNQ